jgi:hypothetical protein
MHPMFVKLFIETDAYDLLAEEEEVKRPCITWTKPASSGRR